MLATSAYQNNAPVFWRSMDMIGGSPRTGWAGLQRRQALAEQLGEPRLRAGALPERDDPQRQDARDGAGTAIARGLVTAADPRGGEG